MSMILDQPGEAGAESSASNPTSRVLDVLNFLAAHPTEAFTLVELANHLGHSKASAYRVLTTMAEAGFLARHPKHKTFTLGVAAVAIGQAALERHRGIDAARREMAVLAAELNVICSVITVVDGDLLLLAKEGKPQSHDGLHRVGERTPLVAPMGIGLMAWHADDEIAAYLAKPAPYLSKEIRAHLYAAIPVIRHRGYSAAAAGPSLRALRQGVILPGGRARDGGFWSDFYALIGKFTAAEVELLDLSQAGEDGIGHISAPVFSPQGTVAFLLLLSGLPKQLTPRETETYAEKLRLAAALVTNEIHGRAPVC